MYKHLLFILEGDEVRKVKDRIITLKESLVSPFFVFMCVCIESGNKNEVEQEHLCGFIELPPVKNIRRKATQLWMKHAVY